VKLLAPHQRFIARIHRRYMLMRVIEQLLIGLAIGSVIGVLLVAIALWRALPTDALAVACPAFGLLAGLIHGLSTLPTRMQAAVEADRQLQLADLLGTALTVSDASDWAAVIRSEADEVCRRLSPFDVVLHRLGARVWGGAGLASGLLVALALIPTFAPSSEARPGLSDNRLMSQAELSRSSSMPRSPAIQAEPERSEHSRYDEPTRVNLDDAKAFAGDPSQRSVGERAASGAGNASTPNANSSGLKPGSSKQDSAPSSDKVGGGGRETSQAHRADSAAGANSASAPAGLSTAPWESSGWPTQAQRMRDQLKSGHLPDAYRDMIGGYFDER